MKTLRSIAALCLFACLFAVPASAATIDFSPLVDTGFAIANGILVPLIGYGLLLLARKLKLDRIIADAAMNKMLHDGIQRGVDALEGEARDALFKDGRKVSIDIGNPAVAAVAGRMVELSPDLLARLGLTEARVKKLVAEKLRATAGSTVPV